ncbi:MAG TPA: hypothetical protein VHB21_02735 [Minicystis sp.]|nr:hypothetical protein [Minicystis sp.]
MGRKATGLLLLAAVAMAAACKGQRESAPARPKTAAPARSYAPSATPSASAPPSAAPASSAAAPSDAPVGAPIAAFEPAKAKACKAASVDVAQYQQRGELAIAGSKDRIAASWLVQLTGKKQQQVAFGTFDPDAKLVGRPRGVGLSEHAAPRLFSVGGEWTVTWFDERGFAYARPKEDPLPAPEIQHLTAIGPGEDDEVGINVVGDEGLVAAVVLASHRDQVSLFRFASGDAAGVRALGVTHHAKTPHHPAVAADAAGVTVAWFEAGQRILGSHFDAAGKEAPAVCTIAPGAKGERSALTLTATSAGSVAVWLDGGALRARGVDARGCPTSPIHEVGNGTWPRAVALTGGVLVAWVTPEGKLVAARLDAKGRPGEKGILVADAPGGVKDPPAAGFGGGRAAFAWTEAMSPTVATRRMVLRTVDPACIP